MLDDLIDIPKPRIALFGPEAFYNFRLGCFELEHIRKLIYKKDNLWKLNFVYRTSDQMQIEILQTIEDYGISLVETYAIGAAWPEEKTRTVLYGSDIVFAPDFIRTSRFKQGVLRFPRTAKQAVEAVCYFSQSVEAFSQETYYAFLHRTDYSL